MVVNMLTDALKDDNLELEIMWVESICNDEAVI